MTGPERPGDQLRSMLGSGVPIIAPGVYDALTARLCERSGFDAVFISGAAVSASLLAEPDLGFITLTEAATHARNIARAVRVPVIADADTGFGSALTISRTIAEFEKAGVAAVVIEDQTSPKRCGHFEGKRIVPASEMASKIRAATEARGASRLVLIARTDAIATDGLDEALQRVRAYRQAGADVVFVEAPESEEQLARIGEMADRGPLMTNLVEGGKTPLLAASRLRELGFSLITYSGTLQKVAIHAMQRALGHLAATGDVSALYPSSMVSLRERSELLDLPKYESLEETLRPV